MHLLVVLLFPLPSVSAYYDVHSLISCSLSSNMLTKTKRLYGKRNAPRVFLLAQDDACQNKICRICIFSSIMGRNSFSHK